MGLVGCAISGRDGVYWGIWRCGMTNNATDSGICPKCGGTGVQGGIPDFSGDRPDQAITLSACDCPAGQALEGKYRPKSGGHPVSRRMQKIAFESKLDDVLRELRTIEEHGGEMTYYEAVCRALVAQALYGSDEGTKLRAQQYVIDRKLGRAPQSVQVAKVDDSDPLEGMSEEERRELLKIALAGGI